MSLTPINERDLIDAVGTRHEVARAQARIVSLVPSITELLFELDLAPQIVGRTGFCIHPKDRVRRVPKVGGTKSIEVARIKRLAPTHLIVNVDENPRATVEELAKFVPHVIVTHPLGPKDNFVLYRLLGRIFSRDEQAQRLCWRLELAYGETMLAAPSWPRQRVLYLIWKAPWMTVARDTYVSQMLATVGWDTYETKSEARYPALNLTPDLLREQDLVLLSSEPYSFRERHRVEILDLLPTGSRTRAALIDGSMTSWYGSRAIQGLTYLRDFRGSLR
ncbi:MAG TPA: helical backbone metal receptor [Burkholderiales bacterium]|nr:helical backbone metal receptor [Burkholderiales bacterium]